MAKKLLTIMALIILYVAYIIQSRPTMTTPFPYYFAHNTYSDTAEAENSHILIIGDHMGKNLDFYIPSLTEQVSTGLTKPMRVFNWSHDNDGLHRTLSKLRSLKSAPKVVIYHGGGKENYEAKFRLSEYSKIKKNFEINQDDKLMSLILTVPVLSKFFYKDLKHVVFKPNVFVEDVNDYPAKTEQYKIDMSYKIFEHELRELYKLSRSKDFNLVLITTPLNLEQPPKKVCDNAKTKTLLKYQDFFKQKMKLEEYKEIYSKLLMLKNETVANAETYYLFGQVALKIGKLQEGKKALQMATAYDCATWRATHVHNELLRQFAKYNEIFLIDFDQLVNHKLGIEEIFLSKYFPQNIYYQTLVKDLVKYIKKIYKL